MSLFPDPPIPKTVGFPLLPKRQRLAATRVVSFALVVAVGPKPHALVCSLGIKKSAWSGVEWTFPSTQLAIHIAVMVTTMRQVYAAAFLAAWAINSIVAGAGRAPATAPTTA